MVESGIQDKIAKIYENYDNQMANTNKKLRRVKEINEELKVITETYLKEVLERTDELENLGQFAASKEFSKKIIEHLSKMVPPVELEASIKNLRTELDQKLAEMERIIKNLKKSKKKKKAEKKTIEQRLAVLSDNQKSGLKGTMSLFDAAKLEHPELSPCCKGKKLLESMSYWPAIFKDEKTEK